MLHKGNIVIAFDIAVIQKMIGYVGRLVASKMVTQIRKNGGKIRSQIQTNRNADHGVKKKIKPLLWTREHGIC